MNKKNALVALAKVMDSERESDHHPVAGLMARALEQHISGKEFNDAFDAAVAEGLIILNPNCGPKQLGVFKLSGI
ncbi:hypothetical protein ACS8E9_18670 [Pseudomonas neustonica]|uniref:hypothetical protein n=1 Tax=Pseudomonas neustonica TaxID=2487346 RepID=UPI003F45D508